MLYGSELQVPASKQLSAARQKPYQKSYLLTGKNVEEFLERETRQANGPVGGERGGRRRVQKEQWE